MTTADLVQSGLLLVGCIALGWNGWAHLQQARAADFSSYLGLMDRYSQAWRGLKEASEDDKDFEFRELLNLIEATCHLYNRKRLGSATRTQIAAYLKEILGGIQKSDYAMKHIVDAISGPETFKEIASFVKKNEITFKN